MSEITQLLRAEGQSPDLKGVFERLYPELKALARARLAAMSGGQTLTPTALVHEAYVKLIQAENLDLQSQRHFFACAGKAMRNIVVDHLRSSGAKKRGGDQVAVTLTENLAGQGDPSQILDLDEALDELDQINPQQRELVEMKFFAGLSIREIAELMELSNRTAWREWQRARAFLHARVAEKT
jgi:RNA polymerase sigma factor (TIGR02999 family)